MISIFFLFTNKHFSILHSQLSLTANEPWLNNKLSLIPQNVEQRDQKISIIGCINTAELFPGLSKIP